MKHVNQKMGELLGRIRAQRLSQYRKKPVEQKAEADGSKGEGDSSANAEEVAALEAMLSTKE